MELYTWFRETVCSENFITKKGVQHSRTTQLRVRSNPMISAGQFSDNGVASSSFYIYDIQCDTI